MNRFTIVLFFLAAVPPLAFASQGRVASSPDRVSSAGGAEPEWTDLKQRMKMAAIYLHGVGVERDVERAIALYASAAEDDLAFAQFRLGRIYLDGELVQPQPRRAYAWLLRAARLGFVDAQVELSRLYANGLGVERSDVEAHKWLDFATSLGAVGLADRRGDLEARMSFSERMLARFLANRCKLRGYEDC